MPSVPRLSELPTEMSAKEFWARMGRLEHEQLDYKREPARLTTLFPAMAMTDGGLVVLGVSDDRQLVGRDLDQRTQDAVTRAAQEVGVDVQLKRLAVDDVPLVAVAVPEIRGHIITTPDGRLVRRVGGDCVPLIGDALGRFVREREERSGEDEPLVAVSPQDFDLSIINRLLAADGHAEVTQEDTFRALVDLGLAEPQLAPADARILRAAAVLTGRAPQQFVPGASVQVVRREGVGPGPGPTSERVELEGPIPDLLDNTLAFVGKHTRSYQAVIGRQRVTLSEYPEAVLREAVLNALAHRDYLLSGTTVDITIWDDRIEIRSPGGLPGHITLENIRDDHYSRNRRVMRALKVLGLVEEYGEGVDRMFDEMEARLMDPPVITPTGSSVTVTLRNRFLVSVEDQAWLGVLGHLQLTAGERRALIFARRDGSVTKRKLRKLMPDGDVDSVLRGAVAKGLLVLTGNAGGARYVLSDEVVLRAGSRGLEAQTRKRQALLDFARERGSVSTSEGAELLDEDLVLVRHLLNDLVQAGQLDARGQTRARRYYA